MPSFEYTAIDRQGKNVQGNVVATTREEAALNLTKTGLLVSRLAEIGAAPAMQRAAVRPGTSAIDQSVHAAKPAVSIAPPTTIAPPTPAAIPEAKPGRANDRQLSFLFSQLASMLKSGLSVQQAAGHLMSRVHNKGTQASLEDMQRGATEGKGISRVMEAYPGIYPPHTVGLMRAGEESGAMPEAALEVANWAEKSHTFKRQFWLLRATAILIPALYPFLAAVVAGSLQSMRDQEASGYKLDNVGAVAHAVGLKLPTVLIWWAGGIAAYYLLRWVWLSQKARPLRHRLVMMMPGIAGRARAESLRLFAWSFGRMSASGHAPQHAWEVASASMPNLYLAEKMAAIGRNADRNTKASTMMRSDEVLIPPEFADMAETAELTGDMPGMMNHIARATDVEFNTRSESAHWVTKLYCYVPFAIMVIVIAYTLYKTLYTGIISIVLEE